MTVDCNCKDCPYRKEIAFLFDIHIWKEDCDKYETEYCKKQTPPKGE